MRRISAPVILAAALLVIPCLVVSARSPNGPELFTAFAPDIVTGKTALVEIRVTRWSTDEERQKLPDILIANGQEGLLAALQQIRPLCGTVRSVNNPAWGLYGSGLFYARQAPTPDGGRHIVLPTGRRVPLPGTTGNMRSMRNQFTLVELQVDKNGKGEGKVISGARVS